MNNKVNKPISKERKSHSLKINIPYDHLITLI